MAINLEVQTDVALKITEQARAQGVSVDTYLRSLIEKKESAVELQKGLSPQEKVRLLRERTANRGLDTPLFSDEAISRESIYGERG